MRLSGVEARDRFAAARVARLATAGADGQPLVVPVTFAVEAAGVPSGAGGGEGDGGDGDGARGAVESAATIVTVVDHKPKSTRRGLRRLRDIRANPLVSLLVDQYDDDWTRLWWARADGLARIVEAGDPRHAAAVAALTARYPQYRQVPPTGPAIVVTVTRWSGWAYADSPGAA
ncbi:TIGR03668 family PPOX class F420-dependent oxidoreductase [Frankia sp. QA3]|uniref:TIGR03668 family PPOX class F420-dependent oxidoreductase n=1 Tax=Frankia sp. QA3 TaxID=710111 RepID=UPI000269BB97|nr:TIGR03668 family PPOX class F420-dependent oxidoreductase [Frankia sp. QA3]EIV91282.1 PPOX class probable F420-dependent enzyme, Rv0121 family [Frankia sp. QA3]